MKESSDLIMLFLVAFLARQFAGLTLSCAELSITIQLPMQDSTCCAGILVPTLLYFDKSLQALPKYVVKCRFGSIFGPNQTLTKTSKRLWLLVLVKH